MEQSNQSQLIHIWEHYEFYLNIPKTFTGSNKPFVYFYYLNAKANKQEWIRKYVVKNGGNIKQLKEEVDLGNLFNYLKSFKIINHSPCDQYHPQINGIY